MIKIGRDQKVYQMSKENQPVAKVAPGSVVEFETYDAFQNQITSPDHEINELNWDTINPATGPIYVEGAEVGDLLKVEIKGIQVADQGVMAAIPNAGLLGDKVEQAEIKIVPIKDNLVHFNDEITFPINPMIGVIGVAPPGAAIPCGTPDSHGGNMDNKMITANTTLYFPVFTEGALLAMGDLHAAMGDGEIMVTGVEVSGKVTVQVDVIKNQKINYPILETASHYYVLASHKDLLEATKLATLEMQRIVMDRLGLSFNEAGMLLSSVGDAEICQVVDPLLTIRFGVSKQLLKSLFE